MSKEKQPAELRAENERYLFERVMQLDKDLAEVRADLSCSDTSLTCARNKRYKAEAERDELRAKLEAVRDEINREYGIRECLEFYANPHNWHTRRKCMVTGKVGVIESHCELAKNSIARSGRDNLERIDAILTKRNQGKEGE